MGEWNLFPSFKNLSLRLYLFLDWFILEKCYPEAIGFNGHKEDKEKHQTSMSLISHHRGHKQPKWLCTGLNIQKAIMNNYLKETLHCAANQPKVTTLMAAVEAAGICLFFFFFFCAVGFVSAVFTHSACFLYLAMTVVFAFCFAPSVSVFRLLIWCSLHLAQILIVIYDAK